ncbi:MAG: bifunctional 4-hydroxy-2-oxoglutarate aldolase/2-dehydro-3-deoxy-phosphogluconate aldolase [Acidobacteriota bacterium]|nr:bifunctional 4-hydroxy-2-oxoglutarate aldolase/2-dehydro-3-deoxy-phosphogluconate aldolase [Acidobacteriota bacterium]
MPPSQHPSSSPLAELLSRAPVLPVLVVKQADDAVPLARALAAGGLPILEITLRTVDALEAVRRIAAEVPEAVVGVGTVTHPAQLDEAAKAGARFAVSPGLPPTLAAAASDAPIPLLPGVQTATEAMAAQDLGFHLLKLFPASVAGGVAALKALGGPLPDLRFCPTGGISAATFRDYLALPNVICVGGSWVAPAAAVAARDWQGITLLAKEASS